MGSISGEVLEQLVLCDVLIIIVIVIKISLTFPHNLLFQKYNHSHQSLSVVLCIKSLVDGKGGGTWGDGAGALTWWKLIST